MQEELTGWIVSGSFDSSSEERCLLVKDFLSKALSFGINLKHVDPWTSTNDLSEIISGKVQAPDFHLYSNVQTGGVLESYGTHGFNSAFATMNCREKFNTSIALYKAKIPQPATISIPLVGERTPVDEIKYFITDAVSVLGGYPIVAKETEGSLGDNVYLIKNDTALLEFILSLKTKNKRGLLQEFIAETSGTDLRLHVVGDQVIGAIKRDSQDDHEFRANVHLGGIGYNYLPSETECAIAVAASKACGCEHSGVDILISNKGPLVCEVNSQPHFFTKEECDVDTASIILSHIQKTMERN